MTNGTENNLTLQQRFAEVFARLPEQDIEQFYAHYQLWLLRRRVPTLEGQIAALQAHIEENQRLIQSLQPSAVALAVLARLQSNGVSDVALLDQMLERGEDWLDRMMQRLDYCEQVEDFIQGDYTQWCLNSLEGAYDWIDTMFGSTKEAEQVQESATTEAEDQATEELLLRKLRQDDEEETPETPLKQPAGTNEQAQVEAGTEQEEILLQTAEQFSMTETGEREETGESENESEIQQSPALLETWTDLEAPPERPAPWYSVNLAEDASAEAAHPEDMNDWIEVLQADTAHMLALKETATAAAGSSEVARPESAPSSEAAGTATGEPAAQHPETTLANVGPQIAEEALQAREELSTAGQPEAGSNEISQPADENMGSSETDAPDHITAETPASTEEETLSASAREIAESELTTDEIEAAPVESTVPSEGLTPASETASVTEAGESAAGEADEAEAAEQSAGDEERTVLAVDAATTAVDPTTRETGAETEPSQETQAADKESITGVQSYEETVIINEISSSEEEQRPWYDYLETDKQATQAMSSQIDVDRDHEENAQATAGISVEHVQPAQEEHRSETENTIEEVSHEEASEQLTTLSENEAASIQGLVNPAQDAASQDDDATVPMALREIQRAREAQLQTASAEIAQDEPVPASESTETTEVVESSEPAKSEIIASFEAEERESETQTTIEESGEPRTQQEASEPAPSSQIAPVTQSAPQPPITAKQPELQQPPSAEPPKKRGFWQRLFGWMRGQ